MFRPGCFGVFSVMVTQVACLTYQSNIVGQVPPQSQEGAVSEQTVPSNASEEYEASSGEGPKANGRFERENAPAGVGRFEREPIVCRFLVQPRAAAEEGCDAEQFIADEVSLLIHALEKDPDWGALISPEIERDGRFVIVANVIPSFDHFRKLRSNQISPELVTLVDSIQKMLENQLFRRTATFALSDGSTVKASLQGGQLKGGKLNDYMEYLTQVGQSEGAEPFFMPYEDVVTEGRAARTGLLWTVEARPRPDQSVEVEFGIRTFEMEIDETNKRLVVRGPSADRTGQLLKALYTVWRGGRVYPLSLPMAAVPNALDEQGKPSSAGPASVDSPSNESFSSPVIQKPLVRSPPLRIAVARIQNQPEGKKRLVLGRGPLPSSGDLFALVFVSELPEQVAFIFGEAVADLAPRVMVPVVGDDSDKSSILRAPPEKVSLAMTSVFRFTGKESPHVLVLRRNQPWTLVEQGLTRWDCEGDPIVDGASLPAVLLPASSRLISWVQEKMAAQMNETWSFTDSAATAFDFSAIPMERIPNGKGNDRALCVWLPFG